MIHPSTDLRLVDPCIGYGVYATQFIPKGSICYVKDALEVEVSPDDPRLTDPVLLEIIEKYSYTDGQGVRIISWDIAKYVNHSCDPNTLSTGYGFEIAIRDILEGEQITDDYGMFNIERPMTCYCGANSCRSIIQADDFDKHADNWNEKAADAMQLIDKVEQPLWKMIDAQTKRRVQRFLRTGKGSPSVGHLNANRLQVIVPVDAPNAPRTPGTPGAPGSREVANTVAV